MVRLHDEPERGWPDHPGRDPRGRPDPGLDRLPAVQHRPVDPVRAASTAAAFAALESITSGEWDRFLLRLRTAIEERRWTPEYERHIVAGMTGPPPEGRRAAGGECQQ